MMTATSFRRACAAGVMGAAAAAGCGGAKGGPGGTEGPPEGPKAEAKLEARSDSKVTGTATFTVEGDMVTFKIEIADAPPGVHAVHIHDHPDCGSHDAESAGGHWNPTNKAHGKWGVDPYHLGDIGNLTVGADGRGSLSLTTNLWTVGTAMSNDVEGHSVMVHANPDDFTTQPSGDAGARIGCGAIRGK